MNKLRLRKIRMHTCPHVDSDGGCDPWITIEQGVTRVFSSLSNVDKFPIRKKKDQDFYDFQVDLDVAGDVRVILYDRDRMPPRDQMVCFLWFHTGFISEIPRLKMTTLTWRGPTKSARCSRMGSSCSLSSPTCRMSCTPLENRPSLRGR